MIFLVPFPLMPLRKLTVQLLTAQGVSEEALHLPHRDADEAANAELPLPLFLLFFFSDHLHLLGYRNRELSCLIQPFSLLFKPPCHYLAHTCQDSSQDYATPVFPAPPCSCGNLGNNPHVCSALASPRKLDLR